MTRGTCAVDGCDRPHWGRELCATHHRRWFRTGNVHAHKPISPRRAKARRFMGALPSLGPIERRPFDIDTARAAAADYSQNRAPA